MTEATDFRGKRIEPGMTVASTGTSLVTPCSSQVHDEAGGRGNQERRASSAGLHPSTPLFARSCPRREMGARMATRRRRGRASQTRGDSTSAPATKSSPIALAWALGKR